MVQTRRSARSRGNDDSDTFATPQPARTRTVTRRVQTARPQRRRDAADESPGAPVETGEKSGAEKPLEKASEAALSDGNESSSEQGSRQRRHKRKRSEGTSSVGDSAAPEKGESGREKRRKLNSSEGECYASGRIVKEQLARLHKEVALPSVVRRNAECSPLLFVDEDMDEKASAVAAGDRDLFRKKRARRRRAQRKKKRETQTASAMGRVIVGDGARGVGMAEALLSKSAVKSWGAVNRSYLQAQSSAITY